LLSGNVEYYMEMLQIVGAGGFGRRREVSGDWSNTGTDCHGYRTSYTT